MSNTPPGPLYDCLHQVVTCIQDVNRVISILNDAPSSGEQDVKESNGEPGFLR